MNCSAVSDYITKYMNIIEIDRKMCEVCKQTKKTLIESVTNKLNIPIEVFKRAN